MSYYWSLCSLFSFVYKLTTIEFFVIFFRRREVLFPSVRRAFVFFILHTIPLSVKPIPPGPTDPLISIKPTQSHLHRSKSHPTQQHKPHPTNTKHTKYSKDVQRHLCSTRTQSQQTSLPTLLLPSQMDFRWKTLLLLALQCQG